MTTYLTSDQIEKIELKARELQFYVWRKRFRGRAPADPIEALEPGIALDLLGYSVRSETSLGQFLDQGRWSEVAGLIDRVDKKVLISMRFDEVHRRFTTSHELGHAVTKTGKAGVRVQFLGPLRSPLPCF